VLSALRSIFLNWVGTEFGQFRQAIRFRAAKRQAIGFGGKRVVETVGLISGASKIKAAKNVTS